MERFAPIEGLRAWLAWAVFFAHITQVAGLSRVGIPTRLTALVGDTSVQVFMIVSGFVIAHLLVAKRESYGSYITRRFFRLFPVYVVCALIGAIAIATAVTPWASDPAYLYGPVLGMLQKTQADNLGAHAFWHATMLHGAVPNNILMLSQYAFLPPAWSASLEWQFYLVAPLALVALRRPITAAIVALVTVIGLYLYGKGTFGEFRLPSILFGSAPFFLIGIASRLSYDRVKASAPAAVGLAALGLGFLWNLPALGAWVAFFTYMFCDRDQLSGADRLTVRVADALFASVPAKWMGQRTYSVYLAHFPVLLLLQTALARLGFQSPPTIASLLLVIGLPLTVVLVELLHRFVELPGIRLGHEAARWGRVSLATAP